MKPTIIFIKHFILILLLFSSSTMAMDRQDFKRIVVQNIYKAIPRDNDTFLLMQAGKNSPNIPVIYSNNENTFKVIKCINSVYFKVGAFSNEMGSIGLAVCPYSVLGREKMKEMKDGFKKELSIMTTYKKPDMKELEEAGLIFMQKSLSDGSELFYFPLILISHGVIVAKTWVLYPPDNSYVFILQYSTDILCKSIEYHSLCDMKNNASIEILVNVMNEYILKKNER
ncbi:hypothetical protein BMS3Bbin11_01790 [bacterium BMS3Bbin11]|nr:hypothetical protein BMS3Abin11_00279 [bacterium BMS3Abin11]GBE46689.1 hypothetical protein BMS3Bbin11_01790 [bacterium BMS3Bbin11]HDH15098.1 hypothetical protein [Gammaproteobacteria bacterium]HDL00792.1 hypothetical protein [candidate division Zixibacteria bacterium]